MKNTTRTFVTLAVSVSLIGLSAIPIIASPESTLGWIVTDIVILGGTYLMLAFPGLFSFLSRSKGQGKSRYLA